MMRNFSALHEKETSFGRVAETTRRDPESLCSVLVEAEQTVFARARHACPARWPGWSGRVKKKPGDEGAQPSQTSQVEVRTGGNEHASVGRKGNVIRQ